MPFDIATGTYSEAASLLPLDASGLPGVVPVTPREPSPYPGVQGTVMDTTGMFGEQAAAGEADCRAAQAAGMDARNAMLAHYAADIAPLGASYGDEMALPVVPPNAVPAEGSGLYPYSGDEPVSAA